MLKFDPNKGILEATAGGYLNAGFPIRDTYVKIGRDQHGILYEPIVKCEKSKIGVIVVHSDGDYGTFNIAGELAKRGYITFGGKPADGTLDQKILSIKNVYRFLKSIRGVEKIVLMGHSGGATLMSAYQAMAEKGADFFRQENFLYPSEIREDIPAADGLMALDSNWGNGSMTLFSIDPAVVEEGNGRKLDPELDIFDPKNGFDPAGAHYSEAFIRKYLAAQRERNNRIIKNALERLHAIQAGKGLYVDDEPLVITGGAQLAPVNKLFPEDLSIFSHTKKEHMLLHADGSATNEIVYSVRPPRGSRSMVDRFGFASEFTTVKKFLSNRAVIAGADYMFKEDGAEGILWENTYDCTPGNIRFVHAPTLCMGMTGGYEYLAAENIYNNSAAEDKTIGFVEGASHNFNAIDPKWGDTEKVLFDYLDSWLSQDGRFL